MAKSIDQQREIGQSCESCRAKTTFKKRATNQLTLFLFFLFDSQSRIDERRRENTSGRAAARVPRNFICKCVCVCFLLSSRVIVERPKDRRVVASWREEEGNVITTTVVGWRELFPFLSSNSTLAAASVVTNGSVCGSRSSGYSTE